MYAGQELYYCAMPPGPELLFSPQTVFIPSFGTGAFVVVVAPKWMPIGC